MKKEERLSKALSTYIKLQYPDVIFTCDASGVRMTIGQAVALKAQRSVHKIPDMIILEPNKFYKGLILELKTVTPYTLNGELKKDKHLEGQQRSLQILAGKGYEAVFAIGFDHCRRVIEHYMSDR